MLIEYSQIILISISALLLICFLQSGMDKINDYHGNLTWLNEHFSNTLLKHTVPFLLLSITILELTAALSFALAIMGLVAYKLPLTLSSITFLCLFAGQRIAKDYEGAYVIVVYFILTVLGFIVLLIDSAINVK